MLENSTREVGTKLDIWIFNIPIFLLAPLFKVQILLKSILNNATQIIRIPYLWADNMVYFIQWSLTDGLLTMSSTCVYNLAIPVELSTLAYVVGWWT